MSHLSRSFYIAVGLLLGCAGGEPARREFRDGAPMRAPPMEPRTTFTPNGAGLPEYWGQPQAELLPRSAEKRVLPPAKGPGIWASDGDGDLPPFAPKGSPRPSISVAGVGLDLGPDVEDGMEAMPATWCAAVLDGGLDDPSRKTAMRLWALTQQRRACTISLAFAMCIDSMKTGGLAEKLLSQFPTSRVTKGEREHILDRLASIRAASIDQARRRCEKPWLQDAMELASEIVGGYGTRPKDVPWMN